MEYAIVVIGASLGGVKALSLLLSGVRSLGPPVVAVVHRGADSDDTLIRALQSATTVPVREAVDKQKLEPGTLHVAPANYHLLVEKDGLALSIEAPVCWARPSIDVLFESAADVWGERVIGIILTGANSDGAQGLARIKRRGGLTVVQQASEALCPAMPEAAMAAAPVDRILPLAGIAEMLADLSREPSR